MNHLHLLIHQILLANIPPNSMDQLDMDYWCYDLHDARSVQIMNIQ